ncbi:MAG: CHASE domain-containing protein [Chloroflexi bacterium]|nr:CHASE domain-containing protein [Chloroflexota bacterium]
MISAVHTQGYYARVLLAAAMGIALSVGAFILLLNVERQEIEEEFEHTANDGASALKQGITMTVDALQDIQSLYKASDEVERHEFRAFIEHELEEDRGIQALEWIPRVLASERAEFEEAARKDGFPEFQIVERESQGTMVPAKLREEYFPVYYVEPYEGNEAALGFDLASNPIRLEALNNSRDTGQGVATARITLVQETEDQFGFLVFQPIYRKGFPVETLDQKRENLAGFALGVFRITDMIDSSLADIRERTGGPGLDIQLYDRSAPQEQQLLFATSSVDGAAVRSPSRLSFAETFDVAGRTWELILTSPGAGLSVWSIWQAWAALAGGLLFTGLFSAYFMAAARRAIAVERLVATRTVELSQSNQQLEDEARERQRTEEALRESEARHRSIVDTAADGIITIDESGTIESFNSAACKLFDYSPDEVIGKNIKTLMPEPYHGAHDGYLANYLRTGDARIIGIGREVVGLRKDGTTFPMDLAVSEVRTEAGRIFTGIVRDLTETQKAEQVLRDEMERAALIQVELLPSQSPTIPHFGLAARCVPARDVAGDFFDWQQRDAGTVDFVLCDVMGKGMPAALLMATVRSALRASSGLPSPAQVLRQVEQAIGDDLRRAESFVTLFYGRLEIEARRITYVDAGHGLGFIRRASGSTEPLEGRNLPLGVFPDSELEESVVTLQEGDMLVLFTDGLVEAQDGTMLDVQTLLTNGDGLKNAETIVDDLIEATGQHRSGGDDATVLILTCTSSG